MRNDITMSKILKRYNETTGSWEPISAPDVSVIQQFENGEKITDSNVVITNENYISDDSESQNTLDDALTTISDDISKLQRNVSWLAKHGTGGGGGGSFNVSYGIEVTYKRGQEIVPLEKGQSIYSEDNTISVSFMITGGSPNDICTYSYRYGNVSVGPIEVEVDKEVTFNVNFDKSATIIISAKNPYNATISPFNFSVYKSSLSIKIDAATAGEFYDGGTNILQISMNRANGVIPILTTNGLGRGSTVTYTLSWAEQKVTFTETTTGETEYKSGIVDIWQLPGVQKQPGLEYPVTITAVATLGNVETPPSRFQTRVKIINPFALTLSMSVNGLYDSNNTIDVEVESPMNIALRAFAPNSVSSAYYAGVIERGNGEVTKIFGKYYSDEIKDAGAEIYDNDTIRIGITKILSYGLSESLYNIDEEVTLRIKAWGVNSTFVDEVAQRIKVTPMTGIFPRQYGKRWSTSETKDIMFASWNSSNAHSTDPSKWTSEVHTYSPIMDESASNMTVILDAVLLNGNGYSGIMSDPARMRLQNNAYAKITIPSDPPEYMEEIMALHTPFDRTLNGYDGYTVSITFMTDDTPLSNRVVMLWGNNMQDGIRLAKGIKITNDHVNWKISDSTELDCNIASGEKHTVDFVYDHNENLAKIYINGILNAAKKVIGTIYEYNNEIFIGANNNNGTISNTCDMSLYELSIYTNVLTDTQIIVNGKNARLNDRSQETITEYNEWKIKNFLVVDEFSNVPLSMFEQTEFSGEYIKGNIAPNSNIPTMMLSFPNTSSDGLAGFTEDYFYSPATKDTIQQFTTESSYYYDNETKTAFDNVQWTVELQGTSTLKYRVKNLEIYTTETVQNDEGETVPILFQPKETWFPESQFTLKADVVDSAHANNTVIGEWVNNCGLLDKTPPMLQLEAHRPKDTDENGVQLRDEFDAPAENKDVTIKHTTEGFPILLFISFAGKGDYTFAGIYSFNLGRYSYYNLGLKFLESFSRYNNSVKDTTCPRKILKYKETNTLGTLSVDNVYSYEFDNLGSDIDSEHPVWSQFGRSENAYSILTSYGDFKYGDKNNIVIRKSLSDLLESVARCPIRYTNIYDGIRNHDLAADGTVTGTYDVITQEASYYALVGEKLHLRNAALYFVIANAFGMTDSIGKNMTLRTWDGTKWYTCFYDMDTALGLDNTGHESIPSNAYIDYITYVFEGAQEGIKTVYHSDAIYVDEDGQEVSEDYPNKISKYTPSFAAYKSKLWALLRDSSFIYDCGDSNPEFSDKVFSGPYINLWSTLRNGLLSRSEKFSNLVAERVAKCGEIIYDRDYDSKYIRDAESTQFLHGTRVEYIRKWLREHMYFLDGVFDINTVSNIRTDGIEDSPYYKDAFGFKAFNKSSTSQDRFDLEITSTIPTFFTIAVDTSKKYYIEEGGKPYTFHINLATNASTQAMFRGASVLTNINGLSQVFEGCTSESVEDCLKSLMNFKTPSAKLQTDAFAGFKRYLDVDTGGRLETIDISNSIFSNANETLDLGGLTKVLRIDVSRTNLATLILPDSSLDYLNVLNSGIGTLKLNGQNKLTSVSIDGCNHITDFQIINCSNIRGIVAAEKPNLIGVTVGLNETVSSVTIDNCPSLTGVTIYSNPALEEIAISNCGSLSNINIYGNRALKRIRLKKCESENLSISIKNCVLESINFEDVMCSKVITLPSKEEMTGLTSLVMSNCFKFSGVKYDGSDLETYETTDGIEYVFDLSPLTALEGSNLRLYNMSVKYVRVNNDPSKPFELYSNTFDKCNNIVRVFGHIMLNDGTFSGFGKFFINHDTSFNPTTYPDWLDISIFAEGTASISEAFNESVYNYAGISPAFVTTEDNPYYTNIKIGPAVTDLDGWFSNTSCDIHDAYYILQLCNDKIKSLNGTFNGCAQLAVEEDEWFDINMFAKCTEVETIDYLFHGCRINCVIVSQPFEPLITNLKRFNEVFSGDYTLLAVGECFFPAGNNLTEIMGFNPKVFEPQGSMYFKDEYLLSNLTKLKNIKNSFNNCAIDFSSGIYDSTDLFKYNVELVLIENSFRKITGVGSLRNIFGGNSTDDTEHFPRKLVTVSNSFTFAEGAHDGELYDGDDGDGVVLPIGNSLFSGCTNLKYITGAYPGQNRTNYDYNSREDETDSFCGDGLLKYLDNVSYSVDDYTAGPDCDPDGFPHQIFKGLVYLEEVTSLFANAKNVKNRNGDEVPELRINLTEYNGVSMFKDCYNLKNISKLFKNLDSSVVCTLSSKPFKNCQLINVESAFERVNISGGIPFGFFYQSTTETWDNGETYQKENPTILNMTGTFREIGNFTGKTPYEANVADLVMDNPDFSVSATPGSKNSFKKIWNLYSYDGTTSFETKMQQAQEMFAGDLYTGENPFSDFIQHARDNWDTLDYRRDDFGDYVGYNLDNVNYAEKFARSNYFCPPDVFKYCVNDTETVVSRTFDMASGGYRNGIFTGLYGRIPEMIFYPLSHLPRIEEIFSRCNSLFPYKWGRMSNGQEVLGYLYPENLFEGINVQSINGLFSQTRIWPKSIVPENFFTPIATILRSVGGLWDGAVWVERNILQLPVTLFANCAALTNVSGMLSNSNGNSIAVIDMSLFTPINNRRIANCSSFLRYATATTGTVPDFWNFENLYPNNQNAEVLGAYYGLSESNIYNYSDILSVGDAEVNPYLRQY